MNRESVRDLRLAEIGGYFMLKPRPCSDSVTQNTPRYRFEGGGRHKLNSWSCWGYKLDLGGPNGGQIRAQRVRNPADIDFGGRRCNLNFWGREAAASMTSEVKTEIKFELSAPNYLPVLEAGIGLIEAVLDPKSKCPQKKIEYGHLPYKTAGSAAVKILCNHQTSEYFWS